MDLIFADEVRDSPVPDEDFLDHPDSGSVIFSEQPLREDSHQSIRQLHPYLILLSSRE